MRSKGLRSPVLLRNLRFGSTTDYIVLAPLTTSYKLTKRRVECHNYTESVSVASFCKAVKNTIFPFEVHYHEVQDVENTKAQI